MLWETKSTYSNFFKVKPAPHTYPMSQRIQEAEIYKTRIKKETLVRFFKVNSKRTRLTHLPNVPKNPGSRNLQKKNKKETLVCFFKVNSKRTRLTHLPNVPKNPGSRNLQKRIKKKR